MSIINAIAADSGDDIFRSLLANMISPQSNTCHPNLGGSDGKFVV
jgi:hypothetical protein